MNFVEFEFNFIRQSRKLNGLSSSFEPINKMNQIEQSEIELPFDYLFDPLDRKNNFS